MYTKQIACTEWKRIMMVLTGTSKQRDPTKIPHAKAHFGSGLHSLAYKKYSVSF